MNRSYRHTRNQMAYLALYYAILGDEDRSESIRQSIRKMDTERQHTQLKFESNPKNIVSTL